MSNILNGLYDAYVPKYKTYMHITVYEEENKKPTLSQTIVSTKHNC